MSRVIVVGAGPGGATLALLLVKRGIEVVLIERQHDFAREFRGEVLFPSGLEPFKQMGLEDALDDVPHVDLSAFELYVHRRKRFRAEFDREFLNQTPPRWTSQPALLEMLVAEAGRYPGFQLERGIRARDLLERDGRIGGVELQDGRKLYGDLVVGADGRTSIVRRLSGVEVRADPTPMDVVWCKLPCPEFFASDPHLRACLGGGHLLIAAPTYDGRMQVAWIIRKGRYGELRERGMPACLDEMALQVSDDLGDHIRHHRNESIQPFLLSTVSDRVSSWSRPGMLLIGDAAHTMSPVGAQGLNIAIRDAVVAAKHLATALASAPNKAAIDAATRAIEAERLPEVKWIQRLQARPPPIILSDTWWSRLVLAVLPPLLNSRAARSATVEIFRKLAFGVTAVDATE